MALNLSNTQIAFTSKSNNELKNAKLLFQVIGIKWLNKLGGAFTKWAITIGLPIKNILKKTVFKQFCGGESLKECTQEIKNMHKNNVFAILDYSVEGKEGEKEYDAAVKEVLETIAYSTKNMATPFVVFKPTAFARFGLLQKVNEGKELSIEEHKEFQRVIDRFDTVCKAVSEKLQLSVMIDAEESWIQDSADALVEQMIAKYNTNRAVVYNTVQLYRWDRIEYLKKLQQQFKGKAKVGVKLVRGAYMEKENERAENNGYPTPICTDKIATDDNFNEGLRFCIENRDVFTIFLGTHNEKSTILLAEKMAEFGLKNDNKNIWFGQLFGMSDNITYNLANANYNAAKYLPYGPVKEVIPYLLRRASENTSVGSQTGRELTLLQKEIERRKVNR